MSLQYVSPLNYKRQTIHRPVAGICYVVVNVAVSFHIALVQISIGSIPLVEYLNSILSALLAWRVEHYILDVHLGLPFRKVLA